MKYIKILGLAAVAAMALMAFVGASSASATVLCSQTPSGTPAACPTASTYGAGTTITGTAEGALLTNNLNPVECEHSETEARITNTGGASSTVVGTIEELNFTGCSTTNIPITNCTVTVEHLPYLGEVHWTEGTHNGTLTGLNHGNGVPGAKVVCGTVINCRFSAEPTLDVNGGNPASVLANEESLTISGGGLLMPICPSTAKWDAEYVATSPTAIWVAKEES